MANKAKHAYGSRENLSEAISSGKVDAYDVLFLSGENEAPAMGWVDKNGNPVIVECGVQRITGEVLPDNGEQGIVYIFKDEGYIWNGTRFVELAKDTDVSNLEASMDSLAVMIADKVDAETVDAKIDEAIDEAISGSLAIVEF